MGNRLCCGKSWSCPSVFQRKRKMGDCKLPEVEGMAYSFFCSHNVAQSLKSNGFSAWSQPRRTLKQQQQQKQNGTKGHDTTGHTCQRGLEQPMSQERSQGLRSEDSSLHYAVIQVCSHTQPRSAKEVKHLQLENATEYAILSFPQATPCCSKNGTLV